MNYAATFLAVWATRRTGLRTLLLLKLNSEEATGLCRPDLAECQQVVPAKAGSTHDTTGTS